MDKTTSESKVILGTFRKCSKGASVCCYNYFCIGSINKTKTENTTNTIPDITDFELDAS